MHLRLGWLLCSLLPLTLSLKFGLEAITDLPLLLKEGKEQLEVFTANAAIPKYGECWANAVGSLRVGCRFLTQEMQSLLALRLTDCFLQMSGQGSIECETLGLDCLKTLTDRQFNAYTEFYTHSQNICYFLQSRLWHEESEKTIDKLSSTSLKVSQQLAAAEKGQEALLQQQGLSLKIQESMAENLESSRSTLRTMMEELRSSTVEQQVALGNLLSQLSALQKWVVGEFSWFDSLIFFISSAVLCCIFTSTSRTRSARLPILLVLAATYILERYLGSLVYSDHDGPVQDKTAALAEWVWFIRRGGICLSVVILIGMAVAHFDYDCVIYETLLEIKKQNAQLLNARDEVDGDSIKLKETTMHIVRENAVQKKPMTSFQGKEMKNESEMDVKTPIVREASEEPVSIRRSKRLQKANISLC